MHRSDFYWSVVTTLGMLLAAAGCRSQRTDGHVQISPGPQTFSKQLEPPQSRLVGNPTAESKAPAGKRPGQKEIAEKIVLTGAATPASKAAASGTSAAVAGGTPLSDKERTALMEAFRDASPEIRALAEQRLAAHQAGQPAGSTVTAEKPAQQVAQQAAAGPDSAGSPANADASAPAPAAVAENAQKNEALPSLEDSTAPAAASAEEPQVAKKDSAAGSSEEAVDIRQAVGEDEAEKKGQVKTVAATSSPTTSEEDPSASKSPASQSSGSDSASPDSLAAASDEQLFQQLIARYQKRLQDESRGESLTGDLVTLRTLTTLAGNPDSAVAPVEDWSRSEQEFLNYQMLALWQMVDPQAHPVRGRRWTMTLPELRQAINHLAASTGNLDVRGMSFCTEVESYGRVKPFPADRFTAGQQVILYSELENFVAERLSDGYETHLRGSYEIFDASGQRVADQVLPEDRQTCNNYRRDYFIAYQLYLPSRLAPGNYRLELTMEDLKGKKYGQGSIPLEITK